MSERKTRNQTLFQYLESLQTEYINAELRKKIYPIVKDKRFYERTMKWKRQKIEDIAQRNELPTIFTNSEEKSRIYEKTYTKYGLPNFLYRNESEIVEFRKWDVINYFAKEAEVKLDEGEGKVSVGTIVDNSDISAIFFDHTDVIDYNKNVVIVKVKGEAAQKPYLIKHISRIL
jgi:hypothetical protein